MKTRKIYIILLLAILSPLSFVACDSANPEIDIRFDTDYTEVMEALRDSRQSLVDKMALIEAALRGGLTGNQSLLGLIQEALESMNGSIQEKLKAIESVMKSSTTSLETKMALAEAAVKQGFADSKTQRQLIKDALDALGGSLEEKLAELESVMKSTNAQLETKLGLIDAAVSSGFADQSQAEALVQSALSSAGKTLVEKLAAVQAAIESHTPGLSTKLTLVEAAVKDGFVNDESLTELIKSAVSALEGTARQKLDDISAAVSNGTAGLETKLALVDAALGTDIADTAAALELIKQAVESLQGSTIEKLDALSAALSGQTTSLETKFGLIITALTQGLSGQKEAIESLQTALDSSLGSLDGDMLQAKTDILTQLSSIATKLSTTELASAFTDIVTAINTQTQTDAQTLAAIQKVVGKILKELGPLTISMTFNLPSSGMKDAWAAGDSIFVFLSNVPAPKYLKMGYDGTQWNYKEKDGATDSSGCLGLNSGIKGAMTALYLPFGSGASVSSSGTSFILSETVTPWYMIATLPYSVEEKTITGTMDFQVAEGYVSFFVPDTEASAATESELRNQHLTPQGIVSIAADGTITHTSIAHGAPLKGFFREGEQKGYIFGGVLSEDVRNVKTDYNFTLVKGGWKGSYYGCSVPATLYTGSADNRSVTLASPSAWTPITDYKPVDVGCDVEYSFQKFRVYWASRNLGATSDDPADEEATYGNYYAWGETIPKTDYSSATYSGTDDDAARAALGGIWRMPKGGEWERLTGDQFKWEWNGKGYVVTSNVAGYDASLFIPAAGYYKGNELLSKGSFSRYWSSTLTTTNNARVLASYDTSTPKVTYDMSRYLGLSVRPVTY
jgi:uncharacterized protein